MSSHSDYDRLFYKSESSNDDIDVFLSNPANKQAADNINREIEIERDNTDMR